MEKEMCEICRYARFKNIPIPTVYASPPIVQTLFCRRYPKEERKENNDWCGEFKKKDKQYNQWG